MVNSHLYVLSSLEKKVFVHIWNLFNCQKPSEVLVDDQL